jgi:hypothetical protein
LLEGLLGKLGKSAKHPLHRNQKLKVVESLDLGQAWVPEYYYDVNFEPGPMTGLAIRQVRQIWQTATTL